MVPVGFSCWRLMGFRFRTRFIIPESPLRASLQGRTRLSSGTVRIAEEDEVREGSKLSFPPSKKQPRNPYGQIQGLLSGGERGIRTPVRAFGPQIDFESIPLRPLRYLSADRLYGRDVSLFPRKNPLNISAQASRRAPSRTVTT